MTPAFLAQLTVCDRAGVWPFPNPPQAITMAQLILLTEARKQATGDKTGGARKPRRLKGKAREDFYRAIGARRQERPGITDADQ